MLTNKVFLRKNKRGNVLKILREHYLRTDIPCGFENCLNCQNQNCYIRLSKDPESLSDLVKQPHYLILDTNVVLDQIDILEEKVMNDVIILQTVLEEVKHKSSNVFKKLNDILVNPDRRFFLFNNEHHQDTYIEREPKESANDRNDRAIRVSALWYKKHLKFSGKEHKIVLLTSDAGNKEKAVGLGITCHSVFDYVKSLKDYPHLSDKLSRKNFGSESDARSIYPPHLGPADIHDGIKNGRLLQGSFLASRENFLEGFVNVESFEDSILIQGHESLNRAIDGDVVAVELFPEDQWTSPSEIVLEDQSDAVEDEINEEIEKVLKKSVEPSKKRASGKVVGIIRRKWRQFCGILQPNQLSGSQRHIFVPADRKIPRIRIETRQGEKLQMQRIIVAIDCWPRYSRYPQGHFVRSLGPLGDKETENEVLLIEHDVPHSKFSEEVLSFLPKMPWTITEEDYAAREDLRGICICSVDPPGCTDIDDALHCRILPNGNFEVGVHIADVSHFIRPGNAMDKEASLRATTVYLVDKRIDMVPELLSSNLCSLRGNVERFAFSCIWEIDSEANIISTKFHKSVIESKAALTYEQAQLLIDDPNKNDDVTLGLRRLNYLAKKLKQRRMEQGALVLASPEIRFQIDSETHDPIEVEAKKMRETNSMVEEFMLLANCSVAAKIFKEFPECAMLRRHPEPPQNNFDPLIKAVKYQGFEIDTTSGKNLADSLDRIQKPDNSYFNTMLRILATRCMMQAVYFISGTLTQQEFFHYGLAAPIYTHFTSPIRRYADIIVHRLLAGCIGADSIHPSLLDKNSNSLLCNNLNFRNRMAQYAGRASVALNTHLFFRNKTEEVEGYVLFVRKNALQILVPKYGLEGTLYLETENFSGKFNYDEENQTQTCGDIVFHSFDPVTVRLSLNSTNIQHEKLVFELIKPYIKGFSLEDGKESMEVEGEETENVQETTADKDSKKRKRKNKEQGKKQKKSIC